MFLIVYREYFSVTFDCSFIGRNKNITCLQISLILYIYIYIDIFVDDILSSGVYIYICR